MTLRRRGEMPPEEVFSRALFGLIMILAAFFEAGKWVILVLGILFLISAFSGVCLTCRLYRKYFAKEQKIQ